MNKITAIKQGKSRNKRVNIFLDEKFAFSLNMEAFAESRLQIGQQITPEDITRLTAADNYHKCMATAARFLSYRPRSEAEMRQRLEKHGYEAGCIGKVLSKLAEYHLVDDHAFAAFWKDNRNTFSPRSRRLTSLELRRKGVPNDIIEQTINNIDDEENAYQAGLSKIRRLSVTDYDTFRKRLGGYLQRRGFGYETVKSTVDKLWKEYNNSYELA